MLCSNIPFTKKNNARNNPNIWTIAFWFFSHNLCLGYRSNGTTENSTLCKTTLFFPEKYQNFTNDKMFIRKSDSDFGKCGIDDLRKEWIPIQELFGIWIECGVHLKNYRHFRFLLNVNSKQMKIVKRNGFSIEHHRPNNHKHCSNWMHIFVENHRLIDSMSSRESDNQSQAYTVTNSVVLSPNGQSTSSPGMFNTDIGRKHLDFSPDHIQCMCEALQQKGDIEKLTTLLYNLPKTELIRPNDSILRYFHWYLIYYLISKFKEKKNDAESFFEKNWTLFSWKFTITEDCQNQRDRKNQKILFMKLKNFNSFFKKRLPCRLEGFYLLL